MAKRYTLYIAKVSERTNGTCLLGTCWYGPTVPESHNVQRYRQTDEETDDMVMPIAAYTV